ncbi:mitochondrial carrier domain-containing protein [Rhodotorula diobovata]|uniref:Mitochondrial carrier domain-containing protein n=1 Tax=Rhodotorula diobovata TaxID=5288 RepID=A0A5C5FW66_9BASI|nr:mitochondrial carrier domain-containing protein [Rhodotorula diobovata]
MSNTADPQAARPAWKDVSYGSAAGIVSKLVEHPLDLTKVRLQSQPLDRAARYSGPWDCIVQTYRNEGLKAFWRGVSMPVAGAMAENATLFVVYNQTQAILQRLYPPSTPSTPDEPAPLSIWQTATAAAVAGAAVSFVLTPVELVKCKMQVSNIAAEGFASSTAAHAVASASHAPAAKPIPSSFMRPNPASPGAIAVTRSILREYGVRGLWLGQTGTLIRETGGGAAWFTTFEVVSQWFIQRRVARGEVSAKDGGRVTKGDLAAWELMSAGAGAGIMYNVVLFPADCIKSTIQTEDELRGKGEAKGPRRGFFQVGKDIYAARGVRGLYNGCGITALRAAPSSALIFYIYSRLEAAFG